MGAAQYDVHTVMLILESWAVTTVVLGLLLSAVMIVQGSTRVVRSSVSRVGLQRQEQLTTAVPQLAAP